VIDCIWNCFVLCTALKAHKKRLREEHTRKRGRSFEGDFRESWS
jgi:hypothetical protein